jgi:hypothetical protein
MNLTANQLMRMLFLLSWAFNEAQGQTQSYSGTNATESASPSLQSPAPKQGNKHRGEVLFVLSLSIVSMAVGIMLCYSSADALSGTARQRGEARRRAALTLTYDNLNEAPQPLGNAQNDVQDVELQAIPSLANTPGINATLKKHIELIEGSELRVPLLIEKKLLSEEQIKKLEAEHPEFCCTLTETLMDIPVLLDNKRYDFKTLLAHREKANTQDPFTRIEFGPAEIIRDDQTRTNMVEALKPLLAQVEEEKSNLLANAM